MDQDSAFESVLNYRPPSTAIHLDEREPEHEDPSRELRDHEWQGADETTSRLTRCLEAVRDITDVIAGLAAAGDPARDKRALKHAILPIHNLAVALAELATDIQRNHAWKLPPAERHSLVRVVRDFRKAVPTEKGVLHALRSQLAAHLTDEMFTSEYRRLWESFSVADVLGWVRSCVRTLECLLVPDVFMWTRESGQENLMSLMTEDGKEELCYVANNEPAGVHSVRIVRSPKEAITREIRALSASCSALSRRLGINEGTRWKPPG